MLLLVSGCLFPYGYLSILVSSLLATSVQFISLTMIIFRFVFAGAVNSAQNLNIQLCFASTNTNNHISAFATLLTAC